MRFIRFGGIATSTSTTRKWKACCPSSEFCHHHVAHTHTAYLKWKEREQPAHTPQCLFIVMRAKIPDINKVRQLIPPLSNEMHKGQAGEPEWLVVSLMQRELKN